MTEHVKRGMTVHKDREIAYKGRHDENPINSVYFCQKCEDKIEVRCRAAQANYVELGCGCGAVSIDLRIGDILGLDIEEWDTKLAHELGRGDR